MFVETELRSDKVVDSRWQLSWRQLELRTIGVRKDWRARVWELFKSVPPFKKLNSSQKIQARFRQLLLICPHMKRNANSTHSSELQCTAPIFDQILMWHCELFAFVWWKTVLTWRWSCVIVNFKKQRKATLHIVGVPPTPLAMEDAGQVYAYQGGEIFTACIKYMCIY